ncbi:hypothetical protein [Nocardia yamanashiensis]|uniref:hypothetical protein n=1 Tax=Nocardia yamanashiensis TaxID=209247 RepID=UPI000A076803|nr:hypothetical protein [Nocardia yamanashiensis]
MRGTRDDTVVADGRTPGVRPLRAREREMTGSGAAPRRDADRVGVWIPADVRQLPLLRSIAETVLLTADFGIDVVTDVRVALDEVITAMILSTTPDRRIDCEFGYGPDRADVTMSVVTLRDAFELNDFGRHLLSSLTDAIEIDHAGYDAGSDGYPLTVRFSRCGRRGGRR